MNAARFALPGALLLAVPAVAERPAPVLSPDRPGLGESQGTPGVGFFNLEVGLAAAISGGRVTPQTTALTLRYGVDDGVEVRALVPDLVLEDGAVVLGPAGLGLKIAGNPGERFSVSAVPTFLVGLDGTAGYQVSVNGGFAVGRLGLWLNATSTVLDGVTVLGGGGATVALDVGGLYVHAGHEAVEGLSFVGGGGWWSVAPRAQIDAGVDVWFGGSDPVVVPTIGTSHAF